MRAIRRLLQVVAFVGTILVGVVAVSLIVSQTPWFRDWLRRYIVRESKQYLNGELSIGGLSGNLLFGVNLSDVAVDISGERVVAVKGLQVDYSVLELISHGIVLDDIKLVQPQLRLERDEHGWNIARLVREQRKEAERKGPGRPVSLDSIEVSDATVTIRDGVGTSGITLPDRIDDLDVKASFKYAPVHYSIDIDHISFRGGSPHVDLRELRGGIAVRDDNVYVENLVLKTGASSVTVQGVVEQYLKTPVAKLTTTGTVSLPEIGRIVPAVAGYPLTPTFAVKAAGPAERMVLDLDVRSQAGNVRGTVTADVKAPQLGVAGTVNVERLNLAPILKNAAQRSDITGTAKLDLEMASTPPKAPILDRLRGSYAFTGPRVVAAGYQAANVRVTGTLQGPRITLSGAANAYGGTATATGWIVPPARGRAFALDLEGRADGIDLRNLPRNLRLPQLATDLSAAEYHVKGAGRTMTASARLNRSTVEGATIHDGTVAEFSTTNGRIAYSARGEVSDLNLPRIGRALRIEALDKPQYDGRVNGSFQVAAQGTTLAEMKLEASGTLTDSTLMDTHLPQLAFETYIDGGALRTHVDGAFENFDPGALSGQEHLKGQITGTVNAKVGIADLTAPITPQAVTADGKVNVSASSVGGLQIDAAEIDGTYAGEKGNLRRLHVEGPDLVADASGAIALDRTSASNVKYHIEATRLAELGRLAGQEGLGGSAVLDGTLTGNAASLRAEGTLDGSGLEYQGNSALDLNTRYSVTIPDLRVAEGTVESTTKATFVKAGGLEINELTATTTYAAKQIKFKTNVKEKTRELDATGDVILHPDHQEIHLPQLAVRTHGIEWTMAPGTSAAIRYGSNRIELQDVRLVSGDQSVDMSGAFAVKGDEPAGTLDVRAKNVDISQLEKLALQDRGLTGRLNADAKISGTPSHPVVDGRVEIANGGFRAYKYDSFAATVNYEGTRIGVDATLQQSPTEAITVQGSVPQTLFRPSPPGHVPARAGDEVDLRVKTTAIGLGMVQGFTSQVTNVTGTVQADVHVTGSGEDPHVEGFVDLKGGAFGVPATGVSYTGLDTRVELTPDLVRIPQLRIIDEEGEPIRIAGELAVHARSVGAVNIQIESNNFEIIDNELGDVGVATQLKVTGEMRRPRIEGDVRLEAARLEVDKILALFYDPYSVKALPDVVSAERTVEESGSAQEATRQALSNAQQSAAPPGAAAAAAADVPPPPGGPMASVALDVHLRIPENLVLRGKDLRPGGPTGAALGNINITVGGDVKIEKAPDEPVLLLGTVDTVRGTYEFQGRRFDLVRGGTVRFTGEPQINPFLDVSATRKIPNTGVEARVHITGTVKAPQLKLTSTPPLEEADILALIVFNRPVNELGTGERASLAATAGGIASGFVAAPLGESIGRALDLDLFEITTTTDQGDLGAGITLGQQIGERAFFKLRQQFGDRSSTEFLIEYQLADFLRLAASAAPETSGSANRIGERRIERAGFDLIFFFSY
jgi:autotransporter translocation and assembly factor TamB